MHKAIFTHRDYKTFGRKKMGGQEFKSPLHLRRQNNVSKRMKLDVILLISCVVLWIYFLFFSPLFIFKKVDIQIENDFKEKELIKEQVTNYFNSAYFFSLYKKNYFLFSENKLKQNLSEFFFIKNIEAKKIFPNGLSIKIERIKPRFILNLPYETLYLDNDGIVLEKYLNSASNTVKFQNDMPLISVNQDSELNIKDVVFSKDFLEFIDKFYSLFKNQQQNLNIESFEAKDIRQSQGSLKVRIKNNGYLYLNTNSSPEYQLENFLTIYKEKIQPQNKVFEYIDLRFGDKVYIK